MFEFKDDNTRKLYEDAWNEYMKNQEEKSVRNIKAGQMFVVVDAEMTALPPSFVGEIARTLDNKEHYIEFIFHPYYPDNNMAMWYKIHPSWFNKGWLRKI